MNKTELSNSMNSANTLLNDVLNVPVKFLGQIVVPTRKDSTRVEVAADYGGVMEYLLNNPVRKEHRKDIAKELLLSISPHAGTFTAVPFRGPGKTISVAISSILGIAVVSSKFSFIADAGNGSAHVYGFQVKTKTKYSEFLQALKQATSVHSSTAKLVSSSASDTFPRSQSDATSLQASSPRHSLTLSTPRTLEGLLGPDPKPKEYEDRIRELEREVERERTNAANAEVQRLSSVLRWITAEKEVGELKTEMAEMRADMAGVASEMAADMAQMKLGITDDRLDTILNDLSLLKTGLEFIDNRMMRRAQNDSAKRRPMWEEIKELGGSTPPLTKRPSSTLVPKMVKREDGSKGSMRDLVKASAEELVLEEKLQSAEKDQLLAHIRDLKSRLMQQTRLEERVKQLELQLSSLEGIKRGLESELKQVSVMRQQDLEHYEQEKKLLADTIAGQLIIPNPLSPNAVKLQDGRPSRLPTRVSKTQLTPPPPGLVSPTAHPSPPKMPHSFFPPSQGSQHNSFANSPHVAADSDAFSGDEDEVDGLRVATPPLDPRGSEILPDPQMALDIQMLQRGMLSTSTFLGKIDERSHVPQRESPKLLDISVDPESGESFCLVMGTKIFLQPGELVEEIEFSKGNGGLGFSITGGNDDCTAEGDTSIYVTKVIEEGAAWLDGRLQIGDKLICVNDRLLLSVSHTQAVGALLHTASTVKLVVSRVPREEYIRVQFAVSTGELGFSIAGGTDSTIDEGETGIFVTNIQPNTPACLGGVLQVGDRLVSVNGISLEHVAHDQAVLILQAYKTNLDMVVARLTVAALEEMLAAENLAQALEDIIRVEYTITDGECGFKIFGGLDQAGGDAEAGLFVAALVEGGPAARDGRLRIGDRLIEVNGLNVLSSSYEEVQAALSAHPLLQLVVSRPPAQVEEILEVVVERGPTGLGFSVAGGNDEENDENDPAIYVTNILPHGPADLCGALQLGDKILRVNGVSLNDVSHGEAVALLQADPRGVQLTVSRLTTLAVPIEEADIVLQRKPGQSLGFKITGGTDEALREQDSAIYVTDVLQGGLASQDGRLRAFDKILEVNGHSLSDLSHQAAIDTLKKASGSVHLRVARYNFGLAEGEYVEYAEIARTGGTLGFSIGGGTDLMLTKDDSSIFVTNVAKGGPASQSNRLHPGDKILLVNGELMVNVTHPQAVKALQSNPQGVKLLVSRIRE